MAEHHPHHHHDQSSGTALRGAAALTVAFAVVEALGGWWTGSLALLSDAGHMLTDGAALALAGLAINLGVMRWLAPHGHDMNARAARLHVAGDALGSVAALISGAVIAFSGWTRIDPLASLVICVLIAVSSVRLLRESLHALMEGVPHGLSVETIGGEMAGVDGVLSVHDLHVWVLSGSRTALSAHVVVRSMAQWERTRRELQTRLHEKFGIDHVTLQPESGVQPLIRH